MSACDGVWGETAGPLPWGGVISQECHHDGLGSLRHRVCVEGLLCVQLCARQAFQGRWGGGMTQKVLEPGARSLHKDGREELGVWKQIRRPCHLSEAASCQEMPVLWVQIPAVISCIRPSDLTSLSLLPHLKIKVSNACCEGSL